MVPRTEIDELEQRIRIFRKQILPQSKRPCHVLVIISLDLEMYGAPRKLGSFHVSSERVRNFTETTELNGGVGSGFERFLNSNPFSIAAFSRLDDIDPETKVRSKEKSEADLLTLG